MSTSTTLFKNKKGKPLFKLSRSRNGDPSSHGGDLKTIISEDLIRSEMGKLIIIVISCLEINSLKNINNKSLLYWLDLNDPYQGDYTYTIFPREKRIWIKAPVYSGRIYKGPIEDYPVEKTSLLSFPFSDRKTYQLMKCFEQLPPKQRSNFLDELTVSNDNLLNEGK